MAEKVRDTLVRAEAELTERVQALRRELFPLEKELADVRLALAAIAPEEPPGLLRLLDNPSGETPSPYKLMTMKELTLHALKEHFPSGATASELLNFFDVTYDRHIPRSSFSPQLSRLKEQGLLRRIGTTWRLPPERNEPSDHKVDGSFVREGQGVGAPRPSLGSNKQSSRTS